MSGSQPSTSPWGEPAPPIGPDPAANGAASTGGARAQSLVDRTPTPTPSANGRPPARRPNPITRRPGPTVRMVAATSAGARVRAAIVLVLIALAVGLAIAGTLGVIIWGIATAIHHASSN